MMKGGSTLLELARERLEPTLSLLGALVETSSHAHNFAGVGRCAELLQEKLTTLGFTANILRIECPEAKQERRHLSAQRPARAHDAPRLLLLGHLDTVFEAQHPFSTISREGNVWRGPGIADMKGGLCTALLALELLHLKRALDPLEIRILFVGDEEQGSASARELLLEAGAWADVTLCFEAAREDGNVVVARKGYGMASIEARGPGGHAGMAHDKAANALTLLARAIERAEAIEREIPGLSVSPGGRVTVEPAAVTRIPQLASAEFEFRFVNEADARQVISKLAEIERSLVAQSPHGPNAHGPNAHGQNAPGGQLRIRAQISTPPFDLTAQGKVLLACYRAAAATVDLQVDGVSTAGVGDINLVAAAGSACLDGVGPCGGGFHTEREYLEIDSIPVRAAAAAQTCLDLIGQPRLVRPRLSAPVAVDHG